mgnify:CR=1 FL=1
MATYYVGGVGRLSLDISDPEKKALAMNQEAVERKLDGIMRRTASGLVSVTRTAAPVYTGPPKRGVVSGALRRGIVPSPLAERSAVPGKVVYDVYMDSGMNDTFVKYSKNGTRYYYPASQEYGFRTAKGRKGGLYFMRDTAVAYYPAVEEATAQAVGELLEEI